MVKTKTITARKTKKKIIIHKGDIKSICEECGHITKQSVVGHLKNMLLFFFALLGMVAFVYFLFLTTTMSVQEIVDVQLNLITNYNAYESDYDMRDVGLEFASGCRLDEDCIILSVHNGLKNMNLTYVKTPTIIDPLEVYRSGAGDCKNFAFMFVSIMHQFGIEAYYDGSAVHRHAVAVAIPEGKDYYYVIDLTDDLNSIAAVGRGYNHWDIPVLN